MTDTFIHFMHMPWESECMKEADEIPEEQRITRLTDWANAAIRNEPLCPACVARVAARTDAVQRWES